MKLCALPPRPLRPHDTQLTLLAFDPRRAGLIRVQRSRWINGSKIRWAVRGGNAADRAEIVRAVAEWQTLAQGLTLQQVDDWQDAEVRIGFGTDGSWSYVGTDCLSIDKSEPTMEFGWALTDAWGKQTARHEWGHALGFPHEHQNPNAGIVWNQAAVLREFSAPPNSWSASQIRSNILDKIPVAEVTGSDWDPDSVMHYPFDAGLILKPEQYQRRALTPKLGLSDRDREQTRSFYPALDPIEPAVVPGVEPPEEKTTLEKGADIWLRDAAPGKEYRFAMMDVPAWTRIRLRTAGDVDTVLVLQDAEGTQILADDDSGFARNAKITTWNFSRQTYYVLLRVVWVGYNARVRMVRE